MERKESYTGGTNFGFGALLIRDKNFVQLTCPFPYYVRTFDSLGFLERKKEKTVRKMNDQLHRFYWQYFRRAKM